MAPEHPANWLCGVKVVHDPNFVKIMFRDEGIGNGRVPLVMDGLPLRRDTYNYAFHIPLPLTAQLGFPLRGFICDDFSELMQSPDNETLRLLSLDIDPNSPTFGNSVATSDGEVMFSRGDIQSLSEEDLRAMEAYARLELADVRALQDINPTSKDYAAARQKAINAATQATPEQYTKFYDLYIRGPVCQTCGIPKGWRETVLSSCSKCKVTHYCGKECQVKDWKIHKVSKEHKGKEEWFLRHVLNPTTLDGNALFYTRGGSKAAQNIARNCENRCMTIWNVWPEDLGLYNNSTDDSNPLACIHRNKQYQQVYYQTMSRAFARLARTSAIVHHSTKDFYNPPTNGIYGTRELPTLRAWTNVNHLVKIGPDGLNFHYDLARDANILMAPLNMQTTDAILNQLALTMGDGSTAEKAASNDTLSCNSLYLGDIASHPLSEFADGSW
ncbi:hypothetical protein CLAFUW4_11250 [Fulvia fulva]|nr:hypothetical protein CLAFUR4_11256 [Fulvia fulva]KAK4621002.1 hypothetical protein CLAFUR0_11261 [Fulvia fulva]WPV17083.1 hypothetical protein CLAFUW4_11250 [Fulvia fulva]WPV31901.1 hypothetical protein CLAFUW7_11246 [Fulvia fulva]